MTRFPHRRRWLASVLPALLALLPAAVPSPSSAQQARITWSVDLPYGEKEVWSMNSDGSNKVNLFPDGLVPPSPFDEVGLIAGPSAGLYPVDPDLPGSPAVRWYLAVVTAPESPYVALVAFAPDGSGGATWRTLTDLPAYPTPDHRMFVSSHVRPVLPTGPNDDFASFQINQATFDGVAWESSYLLVRIADPFTRPAGSVTLDQLQPLVAGGLADPPGAHSWSPDGLTLAYIGSQWYPDGTSRRALRLRDTNTGEDVVLLDTNTIGVQPNRPRWAPDGPSIAFDSNSMWLASSGTYVVDAVTGSIRAVVTADKSTDFYSQPVWSPDLASLAVTKTYYGNRAGRKYEGTIMRVPSSGVTKKAGPVALTPTYVPYRRPTVLGWR